MGITKGHAPANRIADLFAINYVNGVLPAMYLRTGLSSIRKQISFVIDCRNCDDSKGATMIILVKN